MKQRACVLAAVILNVFLISSFSFASGFRLPDQGAAALGMAGAFVGQADDPTAIWYNPAGITQLDGVRAAAGVVGIYPTLTHEAAGGYTDVSERDVHLVPHAYMTQRISDRTAIGVGVTSPFGLQTDWRGNSTVRYVSTFSKAVTMELNPNVAYKLSNNLSVAAGVAYLHLRATLEKKLDFSSMGIGDQNFRLSGDGDGWGANAAIHYKASENLNFGLSYRSRIKVDVQGAAEADIPALGPLNPGSHPAQTEIVLPDLIQFGASCRASENLTLNADLEYTWWSTYDRLVITSDTILGLTALDPSIPDTATQTEETRWRNVWMVRLGGQYRLSNQWKLRAGYVYDKNPVPEEWFDARVPDSDRQGVTVGAGYAAGSMTVDVAYLYLRFNDRTINNSRMDDATADPAALNGAYQSQAHMAGVTVGYKF